MPLLESIFSKIAMNGEVPRYTSDYAALERLFRTKTDVWNFEKDGYETARFDRIVDLARRVPHDSILEVGCAEGHLTRRLAPLAGKMAAIDVSATAVERARRAVPDADIRQARLEDARWDRKFDLVVCSETIYYLKDIPAAIRKLNSLGRYVLVTYTLYEKNRLDPIFSRIPAILNTSFNYLKFFDADRIVNWRGIRIVLWWSGAPWR
ncbi:MAG: methyltransferase domain-containing protein [Elusimicrobia bacterium]|nr:methyltransferase domain-containing protein [Elusimicrobiota bacterium]